jgi:predicted DNA-binding transcriptional regulator AlpA
VEPYFLDNVQIYCGTPRWLTGTFPQPVKLNGTTLAWHSDEIDSWIDQTVINGKKETC